MSITTLSNVLSVRGGQEVVAKNFGVHQTAVSKAKREERKIFIVQDDKGMSAFELKPVFNTNPDLDKISDCLLQQLETA